MTGEHKAARQTEIEQLVSSSLNVRMGKIGKIGRMGWMVL